MIVLDCNAAVAIATGTKEGLAMQSLFMKDEKVMAPQLIMNELANTLAKHVRGKVCDQSEALDIGVDALALVDEFVPADDYWPEAFAEAVRLKHPAYDMFYLALARRRGSTLCTLDKRLQDLCFETGVNCIAIMDA